LARFVVDGARESGRAADATVVDIAEDGSTSGRTSMSPVDSLRFQPNAAPNTFVS
jgi:hypothetical protein